MIGDNNSTITVTTFTIKSTQFTKKLIIINPDMNHPTLYLISGDVS
jgi:hypothetical protein